MILSTNKLVEYYWDLCFEKHKGQLHLRLENMNFTLVFPKGLFSTITDFWGHSIWRSCSAHSSIIEVFNLKPKPHLGEGA